MKFFIIFLSLVFTACSNLNASVSEHSYQSPKQIKIDVPFSPQAPHANWDDPYQEACEEMALIMVDYYLKGKELTPEIADQEILDLVKWEEENGYPEDVDLDQLAEIGCKYFDDCSNYVFSELGIDNIKKIVSEGNPIIVPAAGRDLGNPYFSGEGPWYHMLVITGYDSKRFITNDPGTKRGEGYKYKYNVLPDATHDWAGIKEKIRLGDKRMLVISNGDLPHSEHN